MRSRHREVIVMAEHGAGHHHWVPVVPFHLPHHEPVATGWAQDPFHRIDGLDGLRGAAVLAVLLFHLWPDVLPGGFIGVTLFFALSGFLITSILLHELEHSGTISLRGFYTRRFRRLLPVSLLTLALVAVGWSMVGWLDGALRRDLFFSLGQSANWGQVLLAERYGVSPDASPVLHFWSLSIEEQLYLLLPLTLLLAGTRRRGQVVVGLGIAAGVYAIVRSSDSASLSYYSSFTRAPEVLVGSLAALTMHGRHWLRRSSRAVAGVIVAMGVAALTWVAITSNVTDAAFSQGALFGCAVLSMVVIVAVAGWPTLGRRIDWWPLARLGQISYAVYLFHWPLLQTLRRTSLQPELVPWATLAATLALALLSERWFERPIRTGVVKGPRLAAAALCTAMLVPLVGAVGTVQGEQTTDFEAAAARLDEIIDDSTREPLAPSTTAAGPVLSSIVADAESRWDEQGHMVFAPTTTAPPEPLRIGFFGDSKAMTLGLGTANYGFDELRIGTSYAALGCPTGRGGGLSVGRRLRLVGRCGRGGEPRRRSRCGRRVVGHVGHQRPQGAGPGRRMDRHGGRGLPQLAPRRDARPHRPDRLGHRCPRGAVAHRARRPGVEPSRAVRTLDRAGAGARAAAAEPGAGGRHGRIRERQRRGRTTAARRCAPQPRRRCRSAEHRRRADARRHPADRGFAAHAVTGIGPTTRG
jgi:peptidoglycan/LPS O-acetylase OafA/YrhL